MEVSRGRIVVHVRLTEHGQINVKTKVKVCQVKSFPSALPNPQRHVCKIGMRATLLPLLIKTRRPPFPLTTKCTTFVQPL